LPPDRTPGPLFAVVLGAITLTGPLAIHLFLPALPAVKADFALSDAVAQLTLSVTLFGMAAITLVYGSLSDRHGRRRVLLWGMALFVAGSGAAILADDVWVFLAGRLLQAAGAAAGGALSRAIARDVYGEDKLVKAIAYLTMAYTLGPMIAPPLGGVLVDEFGWRATFGFALALGAAIGVLAWLVLYETHRPHRGAGTGRAMLAGYAPLCGNARFCGFVLQTGFSTGAFFAIAVSSTYLTMDTLGRAATEFGLYFLAFPIGYTSGNFLASRLSGRVPIETMVLAGALLSIATVAVQAALVFAGEVNPWTIFVPGGLVTFAQGVSLPNSQSGAMRVAPAYAGTAAGIGAFASLFFAALFTELVGVFADGTARPMVALACTSSALALVAGMVPFVLARRARA
jgi:DHA1 family bicyclomycin/chloramphenicol resistance-like MFS transporter